MPQSIISSEIQFFLINIFKVNILLLLEIFNDLENFFFQDQQKYYKAKI